MKIALLSFVRSYNFGASLQAYALERIIEEINPAADCEYLIYQRDYKRASIHWLKRKLGLYGKRNSNTPAWTFAEYFSIIIKNICNDGEMSKEQKRRFEEFWELSRYSKIYDRNSIEEAGDIYDRYIVGSDQVWNCGRLDLDTAWMLDFVRDSSKKYSYASSLGMNYIPDEYREEYKKNLRSFTKISCREKSMKEVLETYLDVRSEVHIDPTLLIENDEWASLYKGKSRMQLPTKPYLLLFDLTGKDMSMEDMAKRIAAILHLQIYRVFDPRGNTTDEIGPFEWLHLVYEASFVLTNSFHGTAFSVNFNKPFFSYITRKDFFVSSKDRIESLLQLVKKEEHLINGVDDISPLTVDAVLGEPYDETNQILTKERSRATEYLRMCACG